MAFTNGLPLNWTLKNYEFDYEKNYSNYREIDLGKVDCIIPNLKLWGDVIWGKFKKIKWYVQNGHMVMVKLLLLLDSQKNERKTLIPTATNRVPN